MLNALIIHANGLIRKKRALIHLCLIKKLFVNLDYIKANGIRQFSENQKLRIDILKELLADFNDGRSNNLYCIGCALLPAEKLLEVHDFARGINGGIDQKEKNRQVNKHFIKTADYLGVELKLNNKNKRKKSKS